MEYLSSPFRQTLIKALDSPNAVIGSISMNGHAFIESVKKRKGACMVTVTETNRDALVEEGLRLLR